MVNYNRMTCNILNTIPDTVVIPRSNIYQYSKYTKTPRHGINIIATNNASDDKTCLVSEFTDNMISALRRPEDRTKFAGHTIVLIGAADPAFNIKSHDGSPQRNGGAKNHTILDVDMINHYATNKTTGEIFYRGWNVPVHELGHSIELKLELQTQSDIFYSMKPGYNNDFPREYWAWSCGAWFNSNTKNKTRDQMDKDEYEYLSKTFDVNNNWLPTRSTPTCSCI